MIGEKPLEQIKADCARYRAEREVLKYELETEKAKRALAELRLSWIKTCSERLTTAILHQEPVETITALSRTLDDAIRGTGRD